MKDLWKFRCTFICQNKSVRWIGDFNRMDNKRKESQVLSNNPRGKATKRTKKNMLELFTNRFLRNSKLQIGDKSSKDIWLGEVHLVCEGPHCSPIEEEEEEEKGVFRLGRGRINSAVHATSLTVKNSLYRSLPFCNMLLWHSLNKLF